MKPAYPLLLACALLLAGCATTPQGSGGRLVISGNDGKYPNVDGRYVVAENPPPDTLTILDASTFPPKKIAEIEIQHSVTAPPMTIAITADEKLALVSAPNRVNPADKSKVVTDNFVQVVDLEANPPRITDKVNLGRHPLGVSVNRAGTLALAAHQDGNISVLTIEGKNVKYVDTVKIGEPSSSVRQVAITPDGKWALASKRGDHTVAVLRIEGSKVTYTKRDITAGNNAYSMEISNDGTFAAVANLGRAEGSNDSVTLIDLTRQPFRAVAYFTVGPSPEGLAISPDSKWIAIGARSGTDVPKNSPFRNENGKLQLFSIRDFTATKVAEEAIGRNSQGVSFTPDGRYLVVQNYVEKELAFYRVTGSGLEDTGHRIPVPGHPAGIRIAPR